MHPPKPCPSSAGLGQWPSHLPPKPNNVGGVSTDRLTVRAGDRSAGGRRPGAWAQLPGVNPRLRLRLGWGSPMVGEVLRAAFATEPRAAAPGELRHHLVADLIFGSEQCAVPGPGRGEGRALYPRAEAPACWQVTVPPGWCSGPLSDAWIQSRCLPTSTTSPRVSFFCAYGDRAMGWKQT